MPKNTKYLILNVLFHTQFSAIDTSLPNRTNFKEIRTAYFVLVLTTESLPYYEVVNLIIDMLELKYDVVVIYKLAWHHKK